MPVATLIYILLVAIVAVNVTRVFAIPILGALFPIALIGVILGITHFKIKSTRLTFLTLSVIGVVSLVVISITAVLPTLALLDGTSQAFWTINLLPLFIAAIGLYGVGLWLRGAAAMNSDALDWLANFLSGPGLMLTLLTGVVLSAGTLLGLDWLGQTLEGSQTITRRFLDRGIIPPTTLLFFYWGMLILIGKWWNVFYLKSSLQRWVADPQREVSTHIDRIRSLSDDSTKLEERLLFLWRRHEESFTVPRYIGWVVPVLGFIGTVLGISLAAEGIRQLIGSESGLGGLTTELGSAISPLGIAFDTTLIALSLSVLLMLVLTLVQRSEERTLNTLERHLRESTRTY